VRPVAAVEERSCSDNSCSVSNDKARVCGLWDACPIVVVAQRPVDWRLAAGQLNTVCVCWPKSTQLAAESAPIRCRCRRSHCHGDRRAANNGCCTVSVAVAAAVECDK